ncbi:hypothetical protein SFRURICE_004355 [Spodoptera frugiperda]|nr:hypothetical protein SFRURICE_004355 [Spodoptera frugiperda]
MLQSRQGFGHLLRRTITEFQGSITYLQSPVPSATFHQLPSSSYLPSATFQQLLLSTYLQSTVHHLPTSTIQPTTFHLHYYPSLLDLVTFATFTSRTAGLPCITDGWTTAELRATYPLYRLLTRIVVFYRRTRIRFHHLPTISGSISYLPSATFQQLPSISYLPAATSQHLPTIYGSSSTYINHPTDYLPSSLLSESAGPRDLRDLHVEDGGPTLHHRRLDYCGAASDLPSLPATDQDSGVLPAN